MMTYVELVACRLKEIHAFIRITPSSLESYDSRDVWMNGSKFIKLTHRNSFNTLLQTANQLNASFVIINNNNAHK